MASFLVPGDIRFSRKPVLFGNPRTSVSGRSVVRSTAAYLIHIVRIMNMTSLRPVRQEEINIAGKLWAAYKEPHRKKKQSKGSPITFIQIARKWLRFHNQLETPPSNLFQPLIAEYVEAMRSARRLAPDTVFAYSSKALNFLKWFGERHANLELVSLLDVDDFLASKRAAGWSVRSIASHCQALRCFFRYAAIRGWCAPGLALGIHSPRTPKYDGRPKAPTWAEKFGADLNRMIPALSAYMGQVGLGSTDRYLCLTPERFRAQLDKLSPRRGKKRWRNNPALIKFLTEL